MRVTTTSAAGALLAAAALLAAQTARAAVTAVQTDSVPYQTAGFSDGLSFAKFDPALGTLTAVTYTLRGGVLGSIAVENTSSLPALITADLSADVALARPGGGLLASAFPYAGVSFDAAAFDGTLDYGGTSGHTFGGVGETASALPDPGSTSAPADLALFTGPGDIVLRLTAANLSAAGGAPGLASVLDTSADAVATLDYTYTPAPVPEPMSAALAGAGLVALGASRRTRRRGAV